MAYDEALANRIRDAIGTGPSHSKKKMFGGLAFFDRGRMFAGTLPSKAPK